MSAAADVLLDWQALLALYEQLPPLPREIAVSDAPTLDVLLAGIPKAESSSAAGPLGSLTSVPVVVDDTLPRGQIHVRERDGRVSAIWQLVKGVGWVSLPTVGWPDGVR